MRISLFLYLFFAPYLASAGIIEIGASANYRMSRYNDSNYVQSLTYTGSFSYYFWEMCAWELNYTTGLSTQVTKGSATDKQTKIQDNIDLASLDLVLSFAGRQDPFRPYVKLGGGYLVKERFRQIDEDAKEKISKQQGTVPSGGAGFAVNLTKEFGFKVGIDAWTSPLNEKPVVVDYAGRAGVTWTF